MKNSCRYSVPETSDDDIDGVSLCLASLLLNQNELSLSVPHKWVQYGPGWGFVFVSVWVFHSMVFFSSTFYNLLFKITTGHNRAMTCLAVVKLNSTSFCLSFAPMLELSFGCTDLFHDSDSDASYRCGHPFRVSSSCHSLDSGGKKLLSCLSAMAFQQWNLQYALLIGSELD